VRRGLRRSWPGLRRALLLAGAGVAPGALLGAHLTALIFFLNPALPFAPLPLARGIGVFASAGGLATLLLQLPFFLARPERAARFLPWSLALAFAAAAWLDGMHASLYAYFLPPGINDRLIKAALWLSLAALIAFYTALLHSLHWRRYGWRSRWGLTLVAALSVFVVIERREAFRPSPVPAPRPALVERRERPKLWVVGLDGATLDAILPLAGSGHLPFFGRLLREGAYARLESLAPTQRDALWVTLATGRLPFRHGVVGWRVYRAPYLCDGCVLRLLPQGIRFGDWGLFGQPGFPEPKDSRRALALWEVLWRLGVGSGVVGWPKVAADGGDGVFALPESCFSPREVSCESSPPDLGARVRPLRAAASLLPPDLLARFGEAPAAGVGAALAADRWRLEAVRLARDEHPEAEAVCLLLPGLRDVSRRFFGGFNSVQFAGARKHEAREAADQLAAYYGFLDDSLARLWAEGDDGGRRILAVVSVHGTRAEEGLEWIVGGFSGGLALGGRFQNAPDGVLILFGEGIRKGALVREARLVDAAPTLLYAVGAPLARDLDGRILTSAFEDGFLARNPATFLPSYEGLLPARPSGIPGDGGR
jgi:hypothetical protein